MLLLLGFLGVAVLLDLLINCECDGKFDDDLLGMGCSIRAVSFGLGFRLSTVCLVFIFIFGGDGFGKIAFR